MALKQHKTLPNVFASEHPLVKHKMTCLRDKNTDKRDFRMLVKEITLLLVYESCEKLPLTTRRIETPLESMQAPTLADPTPVIVPILRAGLGMVDGFLELIPTARVGHLGVYRDEKTFKPHDYYCKLPSGSEKALHFICDPMLATGGSAHYAVETLQKRGITNIHFVSLIAAPVGLEHLAKAFPSITIFTAVIDRALNSNCFILPGLGDCGDRLFGTL